MKLNHHHYKKYAKESVEFTNIIAINLYHIWIVKAYSECTKIIVIDETFQ